MGSGAGAVASGGAATHAATTENAGFRDSAKTTFNLGVNKVKERFSTGLSAPPNSIVNRMKDSATQAKAKASEKFSGFAMSHNLPTTLSGAKTAASSKFGELSSKASEKSSQYKDKFNNLSTGKKIGVAAVGSLALGGVALGGGALGLDALEGIGNPGTGMLGNSSGMTGTTGSGLTGTSGLGLSNMF